MSIYLKEKVRQDEMRAMLVVIGDSLRAEHDDPRVIKNLLHQIGESISCYQEDVDLARRESAVLREQIRVSGVLSAEDMSFQLTEAVAEMEKRGTEALAAISALLLVLLRVEKDRIATQIKERESSLRADLFAATKEKFGDGENRTAFECFDARMYTLPQLMKCLAAIEAAITRAELRSGVALCEECGEWIPGQRLVLVPLARHCTSCKEEIDDENTSRVNGREVRRDKVTVAGAITPGRGKTPKRTSV